MTPFNFETLEISLKNIQITFLSVVNKDKTKILTVEAEEKVMHVALSYKYVRIVGLLKFITLINITC